MTQPESEIRTAWRHIAGHHRDGHVEELLIRYAEPHRHYHTATHIMFVLRRLNDACRASAHEPSADLVAAALYHDAIYEPAESDNEARSAVIAARELAEVGWSDTACRSVAAMIVATAAHLAEAHGNQRAVGSGDADPTVMAMLLDADLAILGAEPGAYQAYVNGVRAEYAHIDDTGWRIGRAQVLQRFLERSQLFATTYFRDTYEHRARANIDAELAALRAPHDP